MRQQKVSPGSRQESVLKVRAGDFFLAALMVLGAFSSLLSAHGKKGETALIHTGNEVMSVDLGKDQHIHLDHAMIEVTQGKIQIVESDCPRKICQRSGWILRPGQTIVCAPNKILIEIQGQSQTYQAVSY